MDDEEEPEEIEREPNEPGIDDFHDADEHKFEEDVLEGDEEWETLIEEMDREQLLAALAEKEKRIQEDLDSLPSIFTAERHTESALDVVSSSDYNSECKNCGAKPFSEGPHHTESCSRHQDKLALSTDLAHRHSCTHCGARPFVAGSHHKRDCPRRIKEHIERTITGDYDYSRKCKYCKMKPFSQGPHHGPDCDRQWDYPAYSTELAHKYECSNCGAKPFVAGPHHKQDCQRHFY